MNGEESKPPRKILWLKLPAWAKDVPEDSVLRMTEETAEHYKLPLTPYDPNNKEKGRKVVLFKKSDLQKVVCTVCGEENSHLSFQCPNGDPDRELIGTDMYCYHCKKKNEHFSWRCPEHTLEPFGPLVFPDFSCSYCGAEDDHWIEDCPKQKPIRHPEPLPGHRECLICKKYDDSEHWTEDCPELANGDRKFCFTCQSLGDHDGDDCHEFFETEIFCTCCESTGHWCEDCPREFNEFNGGCKYCEICDWVSHHSTEECILAETPATASGSFTMIR